MWRVANPFPLMLAALSLAGCAPAPADGEVAAAPAARRPATAPAPAEPVMRDTPASGEETSMCDATRAQFAVGQTYSAALAAQARAAAGAKTVRRLVPGQMVTMEFSAGRLNLDTDGSGKVASVRCG